MATFIITDCFLRLSASLMHNLLVAATSAWYRQGFIWHGSTQQHCC